MSPIIDVLRNMIASHAAAYHAVKAVEPGAKVSIAQNCRALVPIDGTQASANATARVKQFYNQTFLDAASLGSYHTSLVGAGPVEQHPEWAGTMDFLGVNYYDRDYAVAAPHPASRCPALSSDVGWVHPQPASVAGVSRCRTAGLPEPPGMTQVFGELTQRYHLPILITENGGDGASPESKAAYIVRLGGERLPEGAVKEKVLRAIARAKSVLPLGSVLTVRALCSAILRVAAAGAALPAR